MFLKTSRRKISLERTLVMGIINVTPDSFSDGGKFFSVDDALSQAERLAAEGADTLGTGGEPRRPKSAQIALDEQPARVVPVVEAVAKRFERPISIDPTKGEVAENALAVG